MKVKLDYKLCMAIGQDTGNRNMRKHNRTAWSTADWNIAAKQANRLLKLAERDERHVPLPPL